MNNWYNRINGLPQTQSPLVNNGMIFQNPVQKMQYIMNAMKNPSAFVKEQFPDIPENIQNDPDAVLNYLKQTRGPQFSQQVQQLSGINGR